MELVLLLVNQISPLRVLDTVTSVINLLEDVRELSPIDVERRAIGSKCLVLCIMLLKKVLLRRSQDIGLVRSTSWLLLLLLRYKSLIIITLRIAVKV